mmetsp:Transcript_1829/g.5829  ORF Transcript_1829/g.5829 Transcript_1829/m.5829 type:complete len:254 (-) Transcript_1829:74-835(-)
MSSDFYPSTFSDPLRSSSPHSQQYKEQMAEFGFDTTPAFSGQMSAEPTLASSFGTDGPLEGDVASVWSGAYDHEPPLLVELGINVGGISSKLRTLSSPSLVLGLRPLSDEAKTMLAEADAAGPLALALALGAALLLRGKVHFGYIYGFGVCASLLAWLLINLLAAHGGISLAAVVSVLGYNLLPSVLLAILAVFWSSLSSSTMGIVAVAIATAWCTLGATRMLNASLDLAHQRALVAYPIALIYACFNLLATF